MLLQLIGVPAYLSLASAGYAFLSLTLVIHFIAGVIGVVGLYGFVYRTRLFLQLFWAVFAVFYIGWEICFQTSILGTDGSVVFDRFNWSSVATISLLFYLPQYFALVRYGFSDTSIWSPQPSNDPQFSVGEPPN